MKRALLLALLLPLSAAARDFADGFERDADANGVPDGWAAAGTAAGAKVGLGPGKDGQGMVLEAAASGEAAAETRLTGRLDLANDYVLSAWILVDGAEGASATLTVQFIDERGDPLGAPQAAASATPRDHWTLVALPASLIDSRTRALAIRATLNNRSSQPATARFDDVAWVAKAFVDGFEADLDKDGFPDRWRSLEGEEFPAFNAASTRIAEGESRSGGHAAGVRAQGRGVGLETRWAVPVDPDRSYELTCWVRTQGVDSGRARAEVEWLDEAEAALGTSRSGSVGDTRGEWTALTLAVQDVPARARKARLRMILAGDDRDARAWFDDVEWLGRVRVRLDTEGREGNVFREDEVRQAGGVSGTLIALGLEAGAYSVFATLRDGRGKQVWEGRVGGAELNVRANLTIPFAFPVRAPGPYEARIEIQANGRPRVQARTSFGIAHDPVFGKRRGGEFGVTWNPWVRTPSGGVLAGTLAGRVCVPLWDLAQRDHPGSDPAGEPMRAVLLGLRRHSLDLVGVLSVPPGAPSGSTLAEYLGSRSRAWEGPLESLVRSHRDSVAWWLVADGASHESAVLEAVAARLKSVNESAALGLLVADGAAAPGTEGVSFVARRHRLAAGGERRDDIAFIEPGEAGDLAWRAVAARAAGTRGLVVAGDGSFLLDPTGAPAAPWYAIRTMNDLLSGSQTVEGELLPGFPAFRNEGRVVLCLRAENEITLDAWLGTDLLAVDLLGRSRRLDIDPSGRARLAVGPEPWFLVIADLAFAETQLSAAFDGLPLLSRAGPQRVSFRFANRFAGEIQGVRLLSVDLPPRWRPVESSLELPQVTPGADAAFPLDIAVPSDARPGSYDVRLRIAFSVNGVRREASLRRRVEVRPEIDLAPRIEPTADGTGLEVTLTLRNRGTRRASFKVYVNRGAGKRTLDDVVTALEPGSERVLRFLAEKDTPGTEYLVGVRGLEDDLFVNGAVTVP